MSSPPVWSPLLRETLLAGQVQSPLALGFGRGSSRLLLVTMDWSIFDNMDVGFKVFQCDDWLCFRFSLRDCQG